MEAAVELCNKYNFTVVNEYKDCRATGLGDLLFLALLIKHDIVKLPIYINLKYFTYVNEYYINPLNALEFRLQLILNLCKSNAIDPNKIYITTNPSENIIQPSNCLKDLRYLSLNLETEKQNIISGPYIIFHTKLRHHGGYNIALLKEKIANFAKTFRTTYKIVLLGERTGPKTIEASWHNITDCYKELQELSKNNNVHDMTVETCDILNYDSYTNDISVIAAAVQNISFGCGGLLSSSLIFGKGTLFHIDRVLKDEWNFNVNTLESNNTTIYVNVDEMIDYIWARYGTRGGT